jgi:hypothetical protein
MKRQQYRPWGIRNVKMKEDWQNDNETLNMTRSLYLQQEEKKERGY